MLALRSRTNISRRGLLGLKGKAINRKQWNIWLQFNCSAVNYISPGVRGDIMLFAQNTSCTRYPHPPCTRRLQPLPCTRNRISVLSFTAPNHLATSKVLRLPLLATTAECCTCHLFLHVLPQQPVKIMERSELIGATGLDQPPEIPSNAAADDDHTLRVIE